jgi:phosphate starvation-inducible protein PhoH and related proteins
MTEITVPVAQPELMSALFGIYDDNITAVESAFGVKVTARGGELKISGETDAADKAARAVGSITAALGRGETLTPQSVSYIISSVGEGSELKLAELGKDCVCVCADGTPVRPKTFGQKRYVEAIRKNTIVMGIGPAGTGKTYLAVALAATALRAHDVERIILTRPAVEAGEKLGFLPGDLQTKVDPYLRPLYDALFRIFGMDNYAKLVDRGCIEIAPLAYMRGRTLDDAFIILDEAQNTTPEQMKMFLTRLGFGSKAVITGDITQIDLPEGKRSGLVEASKILRSIEDIAVVTFSEKDVVRHVLVQKIIAAYEKYDKEGRHGKN